MNKETAERILSIFRHKGDREGLRYNIPVELNGKKYWSATDAHILVCIPETEEVNFDNPPEGVKTPNIAGVIPVFDKEIPIDIIKFKAAYEGIELKQYPITEPCESCETNGKFRYFGYWYDCKACDEKGYIETGRTEMKKNKDAVININGSYVKQYFIRPIVNALTLAESKNLKAVFISKSKVILMADDIIFLLTCISDDLEHMEVVNI